MKIIGETVKKYLISKKGSVKPPVAIFQLEVNLTTIKHWLRNKQLISPDSVWDRNSELKKYKITMLPQDPFLFYHHGVNEFSPFIAGIDFIDDELESIEWGWGNNVFHVVLTESGPKGEPLREIVFYCPLDDVFHLLIHRRAKSDNLRKDYEGTEIALSEKADFCHQVHRSIGWGSSLIFTNALVRLNVFVLGNSHVVRY